MSERNRRMDRRTFLKLAAAGGIAATILNNSAGPTLGSFDETRKSKEEISHEAGHKPDIPDMDVPEATSTPTVEVDKPENQILLNRTRPVITEYDVEASRLPYDTLQEIADSHSDFAWEAFNYLAKNELIPEEVVNSDCGSVRIVVQKNGKSMVGVGVVSQQPDKWLVLTHQLDKKIIDHSNTSQEYFNEIGLGAKLLSAPEGAKLSFVPGRRVIATNALGEEVSEWFLEY